MPYIVSYQKFIDIDRTVEIALPADLEGQRIGVELATIDGVTYVSLPDEVTLPGQQPAEVAASIVNPVTVTSELRAQLRDTSPHLRLISQRMIDQIRASYTIDDEMYFARIGVGAATGLYEPTTDEMQEMTVFGEFVESVREWGRTERAKFGL
jgi:hypothetical protein